MLLGIGIVFEFLNPTLCLSLLCPQIRLSLSPFVDLLFEFLLTFFSLIE